MAKKISKGNASKKSGNILEILESRFNENTKRHKGISWSNVVARLQKNPGKLEVLNFMEDTGGEPDVIGLDKKTGEIIFCDCSPESPDGRRSLCYDRDGLDSRKEFKPKNSAMDMASEIGISMLNEEQYRDLQKLGPFDTKTSSWVKTPDAIRELDGALFGDYRFGTVFIYHNTASSYYAARGFRGILKV